MSPNPLSYFKILMEYFILKYRDAILIMIKGMKKLVGIVGPTGIGKTELAIKIARQFNGEIVGCDSRQVYRFMDIGTAKPSIEDQKSVPYHLIDIVSPDETLSLAQYQKLAYDCIEKIQSEGKLPLLTGGTGQYFWAVVEGWEIPRVSPNFELRKRLENLAQVGKAGDLYQELKMVDPESAKRIDPRNVRRVIRALEVYYTQGKLFSEMKRKESPPYDLLIIGLTMNREELYRKVDLRIEWMLDNGLIEEVKQLIRMGYSVALPSMSGIGYRQITRYLNGEISREEAVQRMKFETHRFIRQQYTWFRTEDKRINWYNLTEKNRDAEIMKLVAGFLHNT